MNLHTRQSWALKCVHTIIQAAIHLRHNQFTCGSFDQAATWMLPEHGTWIYDVRNRRASVVKLAIG